MKQQDQVNSSAHDNRGKKYVSWIVIAALAGGCLYLFISRNKILRDNDIVLKQKQQIIDSVRTDRVYLQADFDAASGKIDQLMSGNANLKDSLQNNRTAIIGLQAQIRAILSDQKSTQADLMKARNMLYQLISRAQTYQLYIAELEKDNQTLTGEKELLLNERDETVEKNIALKMAGRVLHASNIRMEPIHLSTGGKEREKYNAKKVDKFRITFDIDENRIAEGGIKQIYVRIIAPDKKVLYSEPVSGTINTVKGEELKFSIVKEINLIKNEPLKGVVIDWLQTDSYSKGVYEVELYNEGYKIGQRSVALK